MIGLIVHGMEGFDYKEARQRLSIPDDFDVQAMVAVGLLGEPEELPVDLREKEVPTSRKPISEIVVEGPCGQNWSD